LPSKHEALSSNPGTAKKNGTLFCSSFQTKTWVGNTVVNAHNKASQLKLWCFIDLERLMKDTVNEKGGLQNITYITVLFLIYVY
jgi:hypothetical protein